MDSDDMEPVARFVYYEGGWNITKILKKDHGQEEQGENKRQQVFPAQWEAILLHFIAKLMPVE